MAAAAAAVFAYKTISEGAQARITDNFLALYNNLIGLQKAYALSPLNVSAREQLINHYEVIATLYLRKEINCSLVDELMKDYLIGEFSGFRDFIQNKRNAEPTTYNHLLDLMGKWDVKLESLS